MGRGATNTNNGVIMFDFTGGKKKVKNTVVDKKFVVIRMEKYKFDEGTQGSKKYYRSHYGDRGMMAHDLRTEKMDDGYLAKPDETNIDFVGMDAKEIWAAANADFAKHGYHNNIDKRTKPVLNFLIGFSKDFVIPVEMRALHHKIIMEIIGKRFGMKNILYCSQQNDEKSAHYSISLINYNWKTHKTIAREMQKFGDNSLSELQGYVADELIKRRADLGHVRGEYMSKGVNKSVGQANQKLKQVQEELEKVEDKLGSLTVQDINTMLMSLDKKNKNHPEYGNYEKKLEVQMKAAAEAATEMELNNRRATAKEHNDWVKSKMDAMKAMNKVQKLNRSMDRKPG